MKKTFALLAALVALGLGGYYISLSANTNQHMLQCTGGWDC